ncbi:MAG: response regulator [Treponema sp.]|nr:response regulator [Treponema sp.]
MKILVVDDIQTNLIMVQGLLLPYHIQVDLCKSGEAAIKAIQAEHHDLVFMDHIMPGMNGIEAVQAIRALDDSDPYYKNVPIVALTANTHAGSREMFLENGFNDFLPKPIDVAIMYAIIEKWLSVSVQEDGTLKNKTDNGIYLPAIQGIDITKGIARTGGSITQYIGVLTTFHFDTHEKIDIIEQCLESGNLPLYTTYIHGLKGAAAIIGAEELSETAKDLEIAGKRKDAAYINTHNTPFVDTLQCLLADIDKALHTIKLHTNFDREAYESNLLALKNAIAALDAGAMYRSITCLQQLTQTEDTYATVSKIADALLLGEYDKASALLETMHP